MKKTWGFSAPSGPLVFSLRGWRDRARDKIRAGDLVVIVGTLDEPTDENDRGKLLGLMEPTKTPVGSLDYDLAPRPHDFDEEGNYRWPHGLELSNAWRFLEPRKLLSEISSKSFGREGALGLVALTPPEEARVLALPREQVGLLQPFRTKVRIEGLEAVRRRGAPPPSTIRKEVVRARRMPAYTYAMAVEGSTTSAFKIGWAFDFKARRREFNTAALPQLGGLRYEVKLFHLWETAMDAFRMEQWLLTQFDRLRHPANREIVTPMTLATLESVWFEFLASARKR
jgi:hypothetical protein